MPRNVVTLDPRFTAFLRPRRRRQIEAALADRHRYRRERVLADLDEIAPRWRWLFRLYP